MYEKPQLTECMQISISIYMHSARTLYVFLRYGCSSQTVYNWKLWWIYVYICTAQPFASRAQYTCPGRCFWLLFNSQKFTSNFNWKNEVNIRCGVLVKQGISPTACACSAAIRCIILNRGMWADLFSMHEKRRREKVEEKSQNPIIPLLSRFCEHRACVTYSGNAVSLFRTHCFFYGIIPVMLCSSFWFHTDVSCRGCQQSCAAQLRHRYCNGFFC